MADRPAGIRPRCPYQVSFPDAWLSSLSGSGRNLFSNRIKAIKIRFERAIPATEHRSGTRITRAE
jgi:hypothetical protein